MATRFFEGVAAKVFPDSPWQPIDYAFWTAWKNDRDVLFDVWAKKFDAEKQAFEFARFPCCTGVWGGRKEPTVHYVFPIEGFKPLHEFGWAATHWMTIPRGPE